MTAYFIRYSLIGVKKIILKLCSETSHCIGHMDYKKTPEEIGFYIIFETWCYGKMLGIKWLDKVTVGGKMDNFMERYKNKWKLSGETCALWA